MQFHELLSNSGPRFRIFTAFFRWSNFKFRQSLPVFVNGIVMKISIRSRNCVKFSVGETSKRRKFQEPRFLHLLREIMGKILHHRV